MNEPCRPSSLRVDLTTTAFLLMSFYGVAVAAAYALFPDRMSMRGAADVQVPVAVTALAIGLYGVHFAAVKLPVTAMRMNYEPVYRFVMIGYAVAMAAFLLVTNLALFFFMAPLLLIDLLILSVLHLVTLR